MLLRDNVVFYDKRFFEIGTVVFEIFITYKNTNLL